LLLAIKSLSSISTLAHFRGNFSQIEEVLTPLAHKASKEMPTKSCGKLTEKATAGRY